MKRFAFYVRYGLVGVLGGLIQTLSLYIWVDVLKLRDSYLWGVVVGFCIALATTFALQKWWTFRDHSSHRTSRQFVMYTLIALGSVFLNSGLLRVSKSLFDAAGLDFFGGWYLVAEVFIVAVVALLSFFANAVLSFERERRDTKVLVLGASGLVGVELLKALGARGVKSVAPSHHDIDITNAAALRRLLKAEVPTHVVNLAANINVNEIEKDPPSARRLNVEAAANIVDIIASEKLDATYIFMSTSYVFPDGIESSREDAELRPENAYGSTKAQAERMIVDKARAQNVRYHVIRTSWIYGSARPTFVDEVARTLLDGKSFLAATDQRGNLMAAKDLADVIASFIQKGADSGIYHVYDEDGGSGLSRFDIACEVAKCLSVPQKQVQAGRKNDIFTGGKRPSIILMNTKLPKLRDWRVALHEYLEERYGRART